MGKGMTFKKGNKPLTEAEWRKRERDMQNRFDKSAQLEAQKLNYMHEKWAEAQKMDITGSVQELAYCLMFVALHRKFDFDNARLVELNNELESLSDRIATGKMTWWDIRDEAAELGFVVANESGYLEEREENE